MFCFLKWGIWLSRYLIRSSRSNNSSTFCYRKGPSAWSVYHVQHLDACNWAYLYHVSCFPSLTHVWLLATKVCAWREYDNCLLKSNVFFFQKHNQVGTWWNIFRDVERQFSIWLKSRHSMDITVSDLHLHQRSWIWNSLECSCRECFLGNRTFWLLLIFLKALSAHKEREEYAVVVCVCLLLWRRTSLQQWEIAITTLEGFGIQKTCRDDGQ